MTKQFDIPSEFLSVNGAHFTAKEIIQQPAIWLKVMDLFKSVQPALNEYISKIYARKNFDIIFTGAGSSSFIGNILSCLFPTFLDVSTRSIPSTDIVTHPECFINKSKELLLISFARSGDSPESIQAIQLAEKYSKEVYHIIITCNSNGKLMRLEKKENIYYVVLPEDSLDQGLAMTSSFSSMLLFGLMLLCGYDIQKIEEQLKLLNNYGNTILSKYVNEFKKITDLNISRSIFLGSGYLKGIACESSLKLEELTDGKIMSYYDSFVGLRHGPKVLINNETLIVYLFSNNKHSLKYEIDLVKEINSNRPGLYSVGVMEKDIIGLPVDLKIIMSEDDNKLSISEKFLPVVSVLPAQIIAFLKSLAFGLNPDSPSLSGAINRVVKGIIIYPYSCGVYNE